MNSVIWPRSIWPALVFIGLRMLTQLIKIFFPLFLKYIRYITILSVITSGKKYVSWLFLESKKTCFVLFCFFTCRKYVWTTCPELSSFVIVFSFLKLRDYKHTGTLCRTEVLTWRVTLIHCYSPGNPRVKGRASKDATTA